MRKILLVSNMYPSKKFPHYGVFVRNMEHILLEENYKVSKSVLFKSTNKISKLIAYICFYIKTIFKGIFTSYDCIYAHYASHTALPLIFVKKIKPKVKIIMNVHGNDIVPEDSHDEKYIPLVKKILNMSDKIVSPSKYFEDILLRQYGIFKSKIFVSPSGGVDTKLFMKLNKDEAKENIKLDKNMKYIGYVSRIEKDKGWDILLEAISKIRNSIDSNVRFLFIGSGEQDAEFDNLVKSLHLEEVALKFRFLPQADLKNIYNSLELFVFPTYRKSESLGLVGLEAMACETIVLASNTGGPKTYIDDGVNGILFEPKNSDDLAKKILEVLTLENKEKEKIKKKARATSLKYDKEVVKQNVVKKFVEWL